MRLQRTTQGERGIVLIVSLIMLMVVTLIAVSASDLVRNNLKVVRNTESREMARYGARAAIEEALSSLRFTQSPASVFVSSCQRSNRKCYDFNEDGRDDVLVDVAPPRCIMVRPIKNAELDAINVPAQASCFLPQAVYSLCVDAVWEITATATATASGAAISVRQGVAILSALNRLEPSCPV